MGKQEVRTKVKEILDEFKGIDPSEILEIVKEVIEKEIIETKKEE